MLRDAAPTLTGYSDKTIPEATVAIPYIQTSGVEKVEIVLYIVQLH